MADQPANSAPYRLIHDVEFGEDVVVCAFVNMYGCRIGDGSRVGPSSRSSVGCTSARAARSRATRSSARACALGTASSWATGWCSSTTRSPATTSDGGLQTDDDWTLLETTVEDGASIGSGAVVAGGVRVGAGSLVGAGAVVTRDGTRDHRRRRSGRASGRALVGMDAMPPFRRLLSIVGARPNLVKMALIVAQLDRRLPEARHVLVDTGQHYDLLLSRVFFDELGLRTPDHSLGSVGHAR